VITSIDSMLYSLNQLISYYLNAILHHSNTQTLEGNWRSLSRIMNNENLYYIYPTNKISNPDELNSIKNYLYHNFFDMPGAIPLSILCIAIAYHPDKLQELASSTYTQVISSQDLKQSSLLRHPYLYESHTNIAEYLWCHSIYLFLKDDNMPKRYDLVQNVIQINYSILLARFLHCIKIQLRDCIGRFSTVEQFREALQNWINGYTSQTKTHEEYPFEFALIKIEEGHAKNSYSCLIQLKFHDTNNLNSTTIPFQRG
jgi:hypothetical protein